MSGEMWHDNLGAGITAFSIVHTHFRVGPDDETGRFMKYKLLSKLLLHHEFTCPD